MSVIEKPRKGEGEGGAKRRVRVKYKVISSKIIGKKQVDKSL